MTRSCLVDLVAAKAPLQTLLDLLIVEEDSSTTFHS